MDCMAIVTYYGQNGKVTGIGSQFFMPKYMDWMPIELKVFWFLTRGMGEPGAKKILLESQGERMIADVIVPLRHYTRKELQENTDGLEHKIDEFARENGFSRTPRNQ